MRLKSEVAVPGHLSSLEVYKMLLSQNINEMTPIPQSFVSSPARARVSARTHQTRKSVSNPEDSNSSIPFSAIPLPTNKSDHYASGSCGEDGELLNMLASGNHEVFWTLWLRHRKYLLSICLKRLPGAPEDAEDVLSRAMLRAWEKLPSQAWKIENAKAWLARLTINLCVDAYRERKRRSAGCENVDDVTVSDAHLAVCSTQSPEQGLLRNELRSWVRTAVEDLPGHIRSPFVLHFVDDFPCKDVGERLYLTPENVRKRIQRARSLLKKRLEPYLSA